MHQRSKDGGGGHGIGPQIPQHHLYGDGVVVLMPTIKVGHHAEGGVGQFLSLIHI